MWEKEREELLQDYRYRKNILQEITLDDIEKWNNAGVGQKGDKGDTWKPSVDEEGNLAWTKDTSDNPPTTTNIKGPKGDKGEQGIQGVKGDTGNKGEQGIQGPKGENGATWKPSVDSEGNISWINDTSQTVPVTVNIKGPKGDKGEQGLQGIQGEQGPPGKDGSVTNLIDSLESTDTQSALTARQGNVLYNMILEIKKNIGEFIENICTEDNFVLQTEDGNILVKEG